jgi:hypothetical protein
LKLKKEKLKWVKSTYGHCVYQYMRGEHVIATISPIENKEGKIVWQYNIFTGKPRLITSENSSTKYSHLIKPTYPKKRDVKDAIESLVLELKL